jgi:prolyl-tRNA synthetase
MRQSRFFVFTVREAPRDADVISQQLMMRAGMIRKVAAGIYDYLPLALRSIRKFENIVREELNRDGCQEMLMPTVQPKSSGKRADDGSSTGKSCSASRIARKRSSASDRHTRN